MKKRLLLAALLPSLAPLASVELPAEVIEMKAKDTLTVVELDSGDTMAFTLKSGRTVTIELLETKTEILFTTLEELKKESPTERTIYMMTCRLRIDGEEMEMVRYNPVQQAFYEPWTVNGLNIWFDGLRSLSDNFLETHGDCLPTREARFALQDDTLSVSPERLSNWIALPERELDVHQSYGGEDTWMGPYFGADLHGGLDINMPSNTPLYAPISFDTQFYFNAVAKGDNNNRWRGIREWDNGDSWILQTHHIVQPLVPENEPLKQGTRYAYSGGVWAGYTSHTHFVFKVKQPGQDEMFMDPWLLFWQMRENNREREQAIKASIKPLAPGVTGKSVRFSSEGSRAGIWGGQLELFWDFGDGSISRESQPEHVFVNPGVYPVSLIVKDGANADVHTQHITISGENISGRAIWVKSDDARFSQRRESWKTRATAGPANTPATLVFEGKHKQNYPFQPRQISVILGDELGANALEGIQIDIDYIHGDGWLSIERETAADRLQLTLLPLSKRMITQHGFYEAEVVVSHLEAVNSPVRFMIRVDFPVSDPADEVIVKNDGPDSVRSDYFWVAPEFHRPWAAAHSGFFLINKGPAEGEYVRFTPHLNAGKYKVSLYGPPYETPKILQMAGGFFVNVRHLKGSEKVWVEPAKSLEIGTFEFAQGRQGYVEIIADKAEGMIIVDAVKFEKEREEQEDWSNGVLE